MKNLLIITDDAAKIQTFVGLLGQVFAWFYLNWFKLNLLVRLYWLRNFYRVSVLVSDCFHLNLKGVKVYSYSRELAQLDYAVGRLDYWRQTRKLLKQIKALSLKFFQEDGWDTTRVFDTRLCSNLTYEFYVYDQLRQKIIQAVRPDQVIYFTPLKRLKDWLLSWLLTREYRQKLAKFLAASRQPCQLKPAPNLVLLSLDFFRHQKTLAPLLAPLEAAGYRPVYVTDADLAAFLPESRRLAKKYLWQAKAVFKNFHHQWRPMIFYSAILSRLYLQAAQKLFRCLKPKGLIVVSDIRNLEKTLSLIARKNRVRSVLVSPNMILDLAEINSYNITDKVALPGEFIKQKLIQQGVSPKKLIVVGDLQTLNRPRLTKAQVYRLLGIDDLAKKLVLLVSFRPNWLIPLEEKQQFIAWSVAAAAKIPNTVLVIKPHPTERRYRLMEELKAMKLTQMIVADNRQLELVDLLNAAAVVLQTWSMTLFEAVNYSRPVISVNPFNKNYSQFLPVIADGGAVEVNSSESLARWLKILTDHRQPLTRRQLIRAKQAVAQYILPSDGRAAQRAVALLK